MRPTDYLAKEKNLSTVCDFVEILFETLEKTNVRPTESSLYTPASVNLIDDP